MLSIGVLRTYNLLNFMKMVKCLPEFEYFTVFLKNRNFISKIRISKVTDYAVLSRNKNGNSGDMVISNMSQLWWNGC